MSFFDKDIGLGGTGLAVFAVRQRKKHSDADTEASQEGTMKLPSLQDSLGDIKVAAAAASLPVQRRAADTPSAKAGCNAASPAAASSDLEAASQEADSAADSGATEAAGERSEGSTGSRSFAEKSNASDQIGDTPAGSRVQHTHAISRDGQGQDSASTSASQMRDETASAAGRQQHLQSMAPSKQARQEHQSGKAFADGASSSSSDSRAASASSQPDRGGVQCGSDQATRPSSRLPSFAFVPCPAAAESPPGKRDRSSQQRSRYSVALTESPKTGRGLLVR